jgi:hypothetical protein
MGYSSSGLSVRNIKQFLLVWRRSKILPWQVELVQYLSIARSSTFSGEYVWVLNQSHRHDEVFESHSMVVARLHRRRKEATPAGGSHLQVRFRDRVHLIETARASGSPRRRATAQA